MQAAALTAWADGGSKASDYPAGLGAGVVYDSDEVTEIMGAAEATEGLRNAQLGQRP
jgi:hypothetical protein